MVLLVNLVLFLLKMKEKFAGKLEWLQEKWEDLTHSVIESAREGSGITGLFYNNALESLHAIIKKEIEGKKKSLTDIITVIKNVIYYQEKEQIRVVYRSGVQNIYSLRGKSFFLSYKFNFERILYSC